MKKQKIWLSEWCPYNCEFCYNGKKPFEELPIPELKSNYIQILDPAFLSKKNVIEIIYELGRKKFNNKVIKYELVEGINYKDLTPEIAEALHGNRFIKIRFAWDREYNKFYMFKILDTIKMLTKAGYKSNELMCFILYNWKIPFNDCMKKLDLLKVWNVKVSDCCFDGQTSPTFIATYWYQNELVDFRKVCRRHNQIVIFKIDPELK